MNDKELNEVQKLFKEGRRLLNEGEFAEALDFFEKILKINDKLENVWYNIGMCYYQTRQFNKALKAYNKVLELNPNVAYKLDLFYNKALVLKMLQKYEEAIEHFNMIVYNNPSDESFLEDIYREMGHCYLLYGENQKAMEIYSKVLEINPNNEQVKGAYKKAEERLKGKNAKLNYKVLNWLEFKKINIIPLILLFIGISGLIFLITQGYDITLIDFNVEFYFIHFDVYLTLDFLILCILMPFLLLTLNKRIIEIITYVIGFAVILFWVMTVIVYPLLRNFAGVEWLWWERFSLISILLYVIIKWGFSLILSIINPESDIEIPEQDRSL
ncbi:MAG: tetratricopeptide repeat protein [Spirochaetota bacterium]